MTAVYGGAAVSPIAVCAVAAGATAFKGGAVAGGIVLLLRGLVVLESNVIGEGRVGGRIAVIRPAVEIRCAMILISALSSGAISIETSVWRRMRRCVVLTRRRHRQAVLAMTLVI